MTAAGSDTEGDRGVAEQPMADRRSLGRNYWLLWVSSAVSNFGDGVGTDVPVFVTPGFLAAYSLDVGDRFVARLNGAATDLDIEGVIPVVPFDVSASIAVLADWETELGRFKKVMPSDSVAQKFEQPQCTSRWHHHRSSRRRSRRRGSRSGRTPAGTGTGRQKKAQVAQHRHTLLQAPVAKQRRGYNGQLMAMLLFVGVKFVRVKGRRSAGPAV